MQLDGHASSEVPGPGRSYAVAVICEELCKNKVPFVIIDIEGEYSGLKEKFEVIWLGDEDNSDLQWKNKIDLKLLAKYAPDCPPIIFDLSEAYRPREKVNEFLIELYKEISRRRTPYLVILEEADRLSPQVGDRLPIFDEIARRGRKRGLGLMLCTQRPSLVDKNILSQCSNQLIGKLVIRTDLNSVAQFFSGHGLPNQLTGLSPGEFFALGGMVPEPEKVKIRVRETRHGGMTPKLNPTAVRASIEKILETIQAGASQTEIVIPKLEEAAIVPKEETPIVVPKEMTSVMVPKQPLDKIKSEARFESEIEETPEGNWEESEPLEFENTSDSSGAPKIMGLAPMIQAESVPGLLKLEKLTSSLVERKM